MLIIFYAILYIKRYLSTEKSDPCENINEIQNNIKLNDISEFFLLFYWRKIEPWSSHAYLWKSMPSN